MNKIEQTTEQTTAKMIEVGKMYMLRREGGTLAREVRVLRQDGARFVVQDWMGAEFSVYPSQLVV